MSPTASEPFVIRAGTPADAEQISSQRRAMFSDMGGRDPAWLDEIAASFLPWVRTKLETGEYLAWFAMATEGHVAAGAGLWLLDWFPNRRDRKSLRGYVLNVYTEPAYRRRGLARRLMQIVVDECRDRGITMVTLHASEEGRPLYEALGFSATNEMRIQL
jgi:GNAT superfamily N-acetyltransferase